MSVPKEPVVAPNSQELGEDMLQMALRMASEMSDEPVMDLENSLEPVAVSSGKVYITRLSSQSRILKVIVSADRLCILIYLKV